MAASKSPLFSLGLCLNLLDWQPLLPGCTHILRRPCFTPLDSFKVPLFGSSVWSSLQPGSRSHSVGLAAFVPHCALSSPVQSSQPPPPALNADSCCSTALFWPQEGIDMGCIESPLLVLLYSVTQLCEMCPLVHCNVHCRLGYLIV